MKKLILIWILLSVTAARALIFPASGDPAFQSSDDGAAWKFQGEWVGTVGTPISPREFIAAAHVGGGVGDVLRFRGVEYPVVSFRDNFDLRICRVSTEFPEFVPLYELSDEAGKVLRVYGRGAGRGTELTANRIRYQTNYTSLKILGLKKREVEALFPTWIIQGQKVTAIVEIPYQVVAGWTWGSDYRLRWGSMKVLRTTGILVCPFEAGPVESCALANGDSSGGAFIFSDGEWKLAGVAYAVSDSGASYLDKGGLCVEGVCYPADSQIVQPSQSYFTRISANLQWIKSVISER